MARKYSETDNDGHWPEWMKVLMTGYFLVPVLLILWIYSCISSVTSPSTSDSASSITRELEYNEDWPFSAAVALSVTSVPAPPEAESSCGTRAFESIAKWRVRVTDMVTKRFCTSWENTDRRRKDCLNWERFDLVIFSCDADSDYDEKAIPSGVAVFKRRQIRGEYSSDDKFPISDVWSLDGVKKGDVALVSGQPKEEYKARFGRKVILLRGTAIARWR